MKDDLKALLALAYRAPEDSDEFAALLDRLGCTCGGWGVQDIQSYECRPCGPGCVNGDTAIALRAAFQSVVNEPVPESLRKLVERLK